MPRPALAVGQHGTITVREKQPRLWEASTYVRDADGKRRQVRREARTKSAANKALQDALADRPGFGDSGIDRDSRVRVVADAWLAYIAKQVDAGELAPNTHRLYTVVHRNHVLPALGDLRLREATVARIDDFLTALRSRRSASTARTARAVVSGIMGFAVRAGALSQNPVRDVSRITGSTKRSPRALTTAEREQWLTRVDNDYIALRHDIPDLTRFLLSTGLRIGEALAVTFDDVNFAERTVAIDHTITRVDGRGLVRGPTKTRSGARTLTVTPGTAQMLEDRLRVYGDGPVFPSAAGTWRDPSNTARVFREARQRAGFDWLTTHAFRKTVATVLDEGGLTAREIADQMGHSRVSMTQDVYMGRRAVSGRAAETLAAAEETPDAKVTGK